MKRKLNIVLVIVMIICSSLAYLANAYDDNGSENIVSPLNIAITRTSMEFSPMSNGLYCKGTTQVQPGYIAETTVELLRYDGRWVEETEFSERGGTIAIASETCSPRRGYSYCIKVYHRAYNSNGVLIETITETSHEIEYF